MKTLLLFISLSLSTMSTPALAFLSHEEEALLVYDLNRNPGKDIHFDSFRCSMRSRSCLVKFEVGSKTGSCYIDRIADASDIYAERKIEGTQNLTLSSYVQDALASCLK